MSRKKTGREGLLVWLQSRTKGYKGVNVVDFTDSWVDGMAFCALLHSFCPELINYDELKPTDKAANLELAFTLAEKLGIPKLIETSDMLGESGPDKFFVVTYLAQFVDHFRHSNRQSESEGPALSSVRIYEEHSHSVQYEAEHKKRLRSHITKYIDNITMVKGGTVAGTIEVLKKHINSPTHTNPDSPIDTTRGGTVHERIADFKRKTGARASFRRGDSFLLEKVPTGLVAERIATFLKIQEQIKLEIEFIMITSPKARRGSRRESVGSPSTRPMSNIYYVMRNNNANNTNTTNCASASGASLSNSGGVLPPQLVM